MKKNEVKDYVFNTLGDFMKSKGFKTVKKENTFTRKFEGGSHRIVVPINDYFPEYILGFAIAIRIDEAESIFHKYSDAPPLYHDQSNTLIADYGYFFGEVRKEVKITTEQEIDQWLTEFKKVFELKIDDFLKNNSNLATLDQTLNTGNSPDITAAPYNYMHGIIVAHLNHNPEWQTLAKKYAAMPEKLPKMETDRLNNLINGLQ